MIEGETYDRDTDHSDLPKLVLLNGSEKASAEKA